MITPGSLVIGGLALDDFARDLEAALGAGDVACLQLRLKDVSDDAIREATRRLQPLCRARDVAFLLNDRPDLAAELDCDGVHVGQEDTPYDEARRRMGADRIVGVTCKQSRHLAMEAAGAGADYVAFGAFYSSTTKAVSRQADPEILAWWSEMMEVPSVAIGGIMAENCTPLVAAGADFLAVAGGVWGYLGGPAAGVAAINAAIAAASQRVASTQEAKG
ncbi:MAG: thiamine phosphate synthase [Alphaproteobacteria bacterium]|nr:thiamine phosphate synthase [Alphaproteobacteria bacterium]